MRIRDLLRQPILRLLLQRGIILLVFGVGIFILASQLNSRAERFSQRTLALKETKAKLEAAVVLRTQTQQLNDIQGNVENLLLTEGAVLQFVTLMEKASSETGNQLKLTFIGEGKPVPSQRVAGANVLHFSLLLQGTESSFLAFFERMSKFPHLARLTSVEVEGVSGIAAFSTLKANGELFLRQ